MTDISPAKLSAKKSLGEYIMSKKFLSRACKLPLQIKLYAHDALPVQLATRLIQPVYTCISLRIKVMRMTSLVTFTSAPAILGGKRRDGEEMVIELLRCRLH